METKIKYNYQDYLQLSDDRRYEIIDGDLFMVPFPNESHQHVLAYTFNCLFNYVRKNMLGYVYCAPFDILFSEEDVVQPDIIFVSSENAKVITKDNIKGAPDLLVEILSPSTSKRDMGIMKKLYARHGVREYWIVDPKNEMVEVLSLKGLEFESKLHGVQDCLHSRVIKGLTVEVKEIFV